MRKVIRAIFFIITILLLAGLFSCSTQWHLKRIIKKDPDFFRVDTVRNVLEVEIDPLDLDFNCTEILKGGRKIELLVPTRYTRPDGTMKSDSARVKLTPDQKTGNISAKINCPPMEYITLNVPEPYPIYVKPSFWEKTEIFGGGVLAAVVILVFIIIIIKIVRGLKPP